jgi:hypothetical protein
VHSQRALVFHLGVVEEVALDPRARRCLLGLRPELVDDARDRDELHLEGIADQDFVEQDVATRVVMAVGEAGHHGHAFRIDGAGVLAGQALDLGVRADGDEPAVLHGERFSLGDTRIDGVDVCVDDDEVGVAGLSGKDSGNASAEPGTSECGRDRTRRHSQEVSSRRAFAHLMSAPVNRLRAEAYRAIPARAQ